MKKWELFEKAAAPILSDYGVSVIHASKLFKSKKWTEEKKTAFIGEIAVLMKRYVLFGISVTVDDKAYRRVIKTRPVRKPDSEYAACFRVCMLFIPRLIRDARIDHDPTVNFVIEAGHRNAQEAVRLFQTSKPSNTVLANQLLGLNLVDKQRFIATQLADLLAYLSYQHAKDFVVTQIVLPASALLEVLSKGAYIKQFVYNERELANMKLALITEHEKAMAWGRRHTKKP